MQDNIVEREHLYKIRLVDALMNAGVAVNDMLNLRQSMGYEMISNYPEEIAGVANLIRENGYDAVKKEITEAFEKGDYALSNLVSIRRDYIVKTGLERADKAFKTLKDAYVYAYGLSWDNDVEIKLDCGERNVIPEIACLVSLREGNVKIGDKNAGDIWYDGTPDNVMPQIQYRADWIKRNYIYPEKYQYIVNGISETGENYIDRCDTPEKAVNLFKMCHDQYSGEAYISYDDGNSKSAKLLFEVKSDNRIKYVTDNTFDEQLADIANKISVEFLNQGERVEIENRQIHQDKENEEKVVNVSKDDEKKNEKHEEKEMRAAEVTAEDISRGIADEICSLLYGSEASVEQYEDVKDCILVFDGSTDGDKRLMEDLRQLHTRYEGHKTSYEYMKSEEMIGYLLEKAPQLDNRKIINKSNNVTVKTKNLIK